MAGDANLSLQVTQRPGTVPTDCSPLRLRPVYLHCDGQVMRRHVLVCSLGGVDASFLRRLVHTVYVFVLPSVTG